MALHGPGRLAVASRGRRAWIGCALALLVSAAGGRAQGKSLAEPAACKADPALPAFEVAAVTPVAEKDRGYTQLGDFGQSHYTLHNVSLSFLIAFAFKVQRQNFVDAPKDLDNTYFDVRVESADGVPLSYEALMPRMQQLLEQRFCLKAHMGAKQVAGYALVVAKGGPKVAPTRTPEEKGGGYITEHEIRATAADMGGIAMMLASPVGRPVRDDTGLQGKYTLKVQYAQASDTDSTLPSIFTAVKEQLGLELKPAQVTVPTLVVEHLVMTPTEN